MNVKQTGPFVFVTQTSSVLHDCGGGGKEGYILKESTENIAINNKMNHYLEL